jgi:hypothetical protein
VEGRSGAPVSDEEALGERNMRRFSVSLIAGGAIIANTLMATAPVQAQSPLGVIGAVAAGVAGAPYFYGGRNYCFYDDAWNGPGWYWCGYAYRRGYGYGGGYGWNGWRGRGGGGGHGGGHGGHGGGHGGGGHGGGGHGGGHGGGGHGGGGHSGGGGGHH